MKLPVLFLLLTVLVSKGSAQDLTGTWEGSGAMTPYVKLVIVKSGGNYVGYAYDEGMGYCKTNFLGTFDPSTRKLHGKSMGFIEKTFFHGQSAYNLSYSETGNVAVLKGPASPKTTLMKVAAFGMVEIITLTRTSREVDTTEYMRRSLEHADLTVEQPVAALPEPESSTGDETLTKLKESRSTDTVRTISVNEKKIRIRILDNGIEDGDSISIFHNDSIVARNYVVANRPYEFEINAGTGNREHSITLVAHNLGAIPPNTATVIILAGPKTYTINAASGLDKNAMIRIRFTPE